MSEMMKDGIGLTDRLIEVPTPEPETTLAEEISENETENSPVEENLTSAAIEASEKATMDVLDMESASDIGSLDLKKIAEEVDGMNYLQLRATKKQMESNLQMIEMYHSMYDQFSAMAGDATDMAAKIKLSQQLEDSGIDQGVEAFYNEYNDVKENITAVLEVLNTKLEEYDELAKSTKFLTDQMIQSIDSRIRTLKETEGYDPYKLECLEALKNPYLDRTASIEYLKNYRRDLRKMKKMARTGSHDMMKRVAADLESFFQANSLGAFEKYLVATWGGTPAAEEAAIVCLGMIAKSLTCDTYLSHSEYAKVFVMNGMDILAGIWDIDEVTADEYTEKVKELFEIYRIDNEQAS